MTTNQQTEPTARDVAKRLARTMQCNCDLDKWEPERDTGHSHVCRIHRAAKAEIVAIRMAGRVP